MNFLYGAVCLILCLGPLHGATLKESNTVTLANGERIVDDKPFRGIKNIIIQRLFKVAEEVDLKNKEDLALLVNTLKEKVPLKVLESARFQKDVSLALTRDKFLVKEFHQRLAKEERALDSFPLDSCLQKFAGWTDPKGVSIKGVLEESCLLLKKHPEVLKGDFSGFGPKGPQHHHITVLKNLLLYTLLVGSKATNLNNQALSSVIEKFQLFYPTPLVLPKKGKLLPNQNKLLQDLAAQIHLFVDLPGHKQGFWFPNAGYVFGGDFYNPFVSEPLPPQPMGDCSSLIMAVTGFKMLGDPTLRFSTHQLEMAYLLLTCPERRKEFWEPKYNKEDEAVIDAITRFYEPVKEEDLKPGDTLIWRPVNEKGLPILKVGQGHMAVFIGKDPHDPSQVFIIDLKRTDEKDLEGISTRLVPLHKLPRDAWRTYGLRTRNLNPEECSCDL